MGEWADCVEGTVCPSLKIFPSFCCVVSVLAYHADILRAYAGDSRERACRRTASRCEHCGPLCKNVGRRAAECISSHTHTHTLTHSLTHTHTHTHTLTHSLTHSHTHSLTHSLTLTHTHTYTHITTDTPFAPSLVGCSVPDVESSPSTAVHANGDCIQCRRKQRHGRPSPPFLLVLRFRLLFFLLVASCAQPALPARRVQARAWPDKGRVSRL